MTYLAILGMFAIVLAMAFIPEQREPLALGVVSFIVLLLAYLPRLRWGRRPAPATMQAEAQHYTELK
jgi:GABA permease